MVQIKYEGNNQFKVISSSNSKLFVNDLLDVTHFVLNYPLIILNVVRAGNSMGRFTAGKVGGLTVLKLI